ncbi:MAG TPA: hypothetical protein VNY51_02685 [Candidatus Dormibacteraeota bacterium]|nr:hypothetical protein [Candidatus Dormibacteraeota bacterium]
MRLLIIFPWKEIAGGEKTLAKVPRNDFFFVSDGGQVEPGIPALKYIDVCRYTLELSCGKNSRFLTEPSARFGMTRVRRGREKGLQQFGDVDGMHLEVRL